MPTEVNKETLEYLEIKLSDTVRKNVEASVFSYYKKWIAMATGILGIVGLTIGWQTLSSHIRDTASRETTSQVTSAMRAQEQTLTGARLAAEEARNQSHAIKNNVDEKKVEFSTFFARLDTKAEEYRVQSIKNQMSIDEIQKKISELRELNERWYGKYESGGVKDGIVVTINEIKPIIDSISQIILRLEKLESALANVPGSTASAPVNPNLIQTEKPLLRQDLGASNTAAAAVQGRVDQSRSAASATTTVFVQFAGVSRDDIKLLTRELSRRDWIIPGEERLEAAASKQEIRCYYEDDCVIAAKLQQDLEEALTRNGYRSGRTAIISMIQNSNIRKPRPGILELWIEPKRGS